VKISPTNFDKLLILNIEEITDNRGSFMKLFNEDLFLKNNINLNVKEYYHSISNKDVIRGMHFQIPPYSHNKLVHVLSGSIIDIVVDLRKSSNTFKKHFEIKMDNPGTCLFIPEGFAHGFKSLENNTIVQYFVSSGYNPQMDTGIHYDSINYNWNIQEPIVSERDSSFISLDKLKSFF
jgi:dTDP-4-dehydrorhamnose 3,5-epimerase/CDP-3, 6-dideoxy-D-glycero-D-glycero-4-hexulose-5-epimerase